jgi:hypothetical protein
MAKHGQIPILDCSLTYSQSDTHLPLSMDFISISFPSPEQQDDFKELQTGLREISEGLEFAK